MLLNIGLLRDWHLGGLVLFLATIAASIGLALWFIDTWDGDNWTQSLRISVAGLLTGSGFAVLISEVNWMAERQGLKRQVRLFSEARRLSGRAAWLLGDMIYDWTTKKHNSSDFAQLCASAGIADSLATRLDQQIVTGPLGEYRFQTINDEIGKLLLFAGADVWSFYSAGECISSFLEACAHSNTIPRARSWCALENKLRASMNNVEPWCPDRQVCNLGIRIARARAAEKIDDTLARVLMLFVWGYFTTLDVPSSSRVDGIRAFIDSSWKSDLKSLGTRACRLKIELRLERR